MLRWLVVLAACGAPPRPPVQPVPVAAAHRVAHYRNPQFRIGAVIDLADTEHPVIQLDGDRVAERLDRRGASYVDQRGRTILHVVDDGTVIVFVHGGDVGVALGRDRDL